MPKFQNHVILLIFESFLKVCVILISRNKTTNWLEDLIFLMVGQHHENFVGTYLEKAFEGKIAPKEALDGAVKDGNVYLEAFQKKYEPIQGST